MVFSLRRRLLFILLGSVLVTWLVSVALTALFAQRTVSEQIDRQLLQYMDMAYHTMSVVIEDPEARRFFWKGRDLQRLKGEDVSYVRVSGFGSQGIEQATNLWFEDSQVLVGDKAPAFPAPESAGFQDHALALPESETSWRILYRHNDALNIWIAVGIDLDYATQHSSAFTSLRMLLPLILVLPVTLFILWWGVGRGLKPLNYLASNIRARQPFSLDPIDVTQVPKELEPVVNALNDLLTRLQIALTSEQRFTANAAHELQTPLAAIKAEVQRYQRLDLDDTVQTMLDRIGSRVTRAANTVSQLLTLARLDPEQNFQRQPVHLNTLILDVMAEEGGLALERQVDFQIAEDDDVVIMGHQDWLMILVRNLLNNAFKYCSVPGQVLISLQKDKQRSLLIVANDCEAISSSDMPRLTDRFFTLPGRDASGSGLGLSIAERIAGLHNATLTISHWRKKSGFRIEIAFPQSHVSGVENS